MSASFARRRCVLLFVEQKRLINLCICLIVGQNVAQIKMILFSLFFPPCVIRIRVCMRLQFQFGMGNNQHM